MSSALRKKSGKSEEEGKEKGRRREGGRVLEKGNSRVSKKYKYGKTNIIAGYSALHLLVDGACALAMFGRFILKDNGYLYILLYNFCAFALQMPMGVMLDVLNAGRSKKRDYVFATAVLGVFCTILGALTHPVVLGIGNALFHIGGGVGVTKADMAGHSAVNSLSADDLVRNVSAAGPSLDNALAADSSPTGDLLPEGGLPEEPRPGKWYGQGLGIFVAPGALGLYLGTLAAKSGAWKAGFLCVSVLMTFLCAALRYWGKGRSERDIGMVSAGMENRKAMWQECAGKEWAEQKWARKECAEREWARKESAEPEAVRRVSAKPEILSMFFCMAVVILRSHIGMTVGFPWKTGVTAGTLAVLAVVGGKMAGGFAAAKLGLYKTAVLSLALAAFCYLFSAVMPFGLAASFLFNMTMPLTLYWMICRMPKRPGFAFGFLTFALFLGFLPGYFGLVQTFAGDIAGCAGSILSLLLLAAMMGRKRG